MAPRILCLSALLAALTFTGCRTAAPTATAAPDAAPGITVTAEDRALVARAQVVLDTVGTTPGREHANRLNHPAAVKFRKQLAENDTLQMAQGAYNYQRNNVKGAVENAEKGMTFQVPADRDLPYAVKPVIFDGKLDDPAWKNAATVTGLYPFNSQDLAAEPQTTFRVTWDERYLYFAFQCQDADIIAAARDRDDHVYFDDCVEMFILPELRTRTYWELVVSPAGSVYDGLKTKQLDQWGSIEDVSQHVDGLQLGISIDGTLGDSSDSDRGYIVEVGVPWDQLPEYSRAAPSAGQAIRFVMIRLDVNTVPGETDKDGKPKTKMDAYAHHPLMAWGHNIWNHGRWILRK